MHVRNLVNPGAPLPLRVRPLPWEGLASVISRAARRMGYEQPKWLLQLENSSYRLREEDLPWLCRKEDFLHLEHLLYLDEETLYRTTVHRFAPILQYETDLPVLQNARLVARPLLSERSYFQDPLSMKVCPACLGQQDGYDRLYWLAEFILLCPNHALPLRTNCPYCKMRIPALRAELCRCPFCKRGDYRVPTAHVLKNSVLFEGELLLLRSLGEPLPQVNAPADILLDSPLLGLRPVDYFHLYRSLTIALSRLFQPEDIPKLCLKLRVLTPDEMATHSILYGASQAPEVVLFHALFSRWPHNFFLFLDEEELPGEVYAWILQAYRDHLEQFQREKPSSRRK